MQAKTTDLCDQYAGELQVAAPSFRSYGGKVAFSGPISTVQVYEDNVLVRAALEEPGAGRVLVVDGGGSLRCALVGDQLAALGLGNGWAGVVINGCIRDVAALRELPSACRRWRPPRCGAPSAAVARAMCRCTSPGWRVGLGSTCMPMRMASSLPSGR
jgi:RraA family protein